MGRPKDQPSRLNPITWCFLSSLKTLLTSSQRIPSGRGTRYPKFRPQSEEMKKNRKAALAPTSRRARSVTAVRIRRLVHACTANVGPTMASAPRRPSGARPLTGGLAEAALCLRPEDLLRPGRLSRLVSLGAVRRQPQPPFDLASHIRPFGKKNGVTR